MKKSKRNIPDPISPQHVVNPTDNVDQRTQDHLEEKTSIEEIYSETDTVKKEKQLPKDKGTERERNAGLDVNTEG